MKGSHDKRGQAGNEAWVLIGLIALLLVFYILFLPPEERSKLLDDTNTETTIGGGFTNATLLSEHVGTLEAHEPIITHVIPSSRIFEAKKASVLEAFNPLYVTHGWFSEKKETVTFGITDPANVDNVLLAFDAPVRSGVLTVKLNNKIIFESPVTKNPAPIRLRKDYLTNENTLEFSVSNVGFAFWRSNEVQISNPQVLGDVTDVTKQRAQNVFAVSPVEKNNVVLATLSYNADCVESEVGPLIIMLNDQRVYNGVPDCNGKNRLEIGGNVLQEGTNTLYFQTQNGDYFLSSMTLTTTLQKTKSYISYFEVPQNVITSVKSGQSTVLLQIVFVDDKTPKRAQLNVNGYLTFIDQVEPNYQKNLGQFVLSGPRNYIEIVPDGSISIPELRVVVK